MCTAAAGAGPGPGRLGLGLVGDHPGGGGDVGPAHAVEDLTQPVGAGWALGQSGTTSNSMLMS
ncbi:hypothetical protein [Streptomyces prunicolor]|uniref:hypothetical protein n=1 Tax=Streptomyces prunicolor TaxID=67348 RepID=UPI0003AAE35C|nr:hypothetical protein [Streptomyces prunicolor]